MNRDESMNCAAEQRQCKLHDRLNAIRMSASDRQIAIASLRSAEHLCELFERTAGMLQSIRIALVTPLLRWLAQSR